MARTTDLTAVRRRLFIQAAGIFISSVAMAAQIYSAPLFDKVPYHTSALSGEAWLLELIEGHPERIKTELGMQRHVFLRLVEELRTVGLSGSRNVSLEEQLAIFLYTAVTGLSIRHVGERFQHANATISRHVHSVCLAKRHVNSLSFRYFRLILFALSSSPFYQKYIHLPRSSAPIPPEILDNSKFFPFFEGAIGAMDGSHFNCCPSSLERQYARDRKGGISMNLLACCSFDLRFQYILSGWDGSAADATMYNEARLSDLLIPPGKYYLADAGFGICDSLLVPYRGVRYHLAEWGRASVRYVLNTL